MYKKSRRRRAVRAGELVELVPLLVPDGAKSAVVVNAVVASEKGNLRRGTRIGRND